MQLERRLVEAGFFCILVVATTAFHYSMGFYSPFPQLTGAPLQHDPFQNYLLVLAGAGVAYFTARVGCAGVSAIIPAHLKQKQYRGWPATLALAVVLASFLTVGAAPAFEKHALVKWLRKNWENNGRSDSLWCMRLFVLLAVWQCLFLGLAHILRVWWSLLKRCVNGVAQTGYGSGGGRAKSAAMNAAFIADKDRVASDGGLPGNSRGTGSNGEGHNHSKGRGAGAWEEQQHVQSIRCADTIDR